MAAKSKDEETTLTIEELAAKNAELEARLAKAEAGALTDADSGIIAAKVAAGLTPDQAAEVVRNQKRHDAGLAKAKK